MPTYQALQQVGVIDGTQIPANKTDSRIVAAKQADTIATKDYTANNAAAPALALNDLIYLGRVRSGEVLIEVGYLTDTSFGAVTVSIGTIAAPAKYVNAQLQTALNTWTPLPQVATTITAGPLSADEDIYAKVSGAVPAAVVAHWRMKTLGVR